MAEPSYNYSYTPTVEHRESNLFREEYYSGTDVKIYFDDEDQTEIGYISYELQEQLKPVYGYNSRTFDDVVIGNRIVTGTFSVPIKNTAKQRWGKDNTINEKKRQSEREKYNIEQNQNLQNTDWFGSTAKTVRSHSNNEIDDKIVVKLLALGYNLDINNIKYNDYVKALKHFQKDHQLGVTGEPNTTTRDKIDQEFKKINSETIDLTGKKGYMRMTFKDRGVNLSGDGLIISRVKTSDSMIYQVLDNKGNRYYIKGE